MPRFLDTSCSGTPLVNNSLADLILLSAICHLRALYGQAGVLLPILRGCAQPVIAGLGTHLSDWRHVVQQCQVWNQKMQAATTVANDLMGFIFRFLRRPQLMPLAAIPDYSSQREKGQGAASFDLRLTTHFFYFHCNLRILFSPMNNKNTFASG
jgi:hypothetical protein